jgi:hypothetical protein
VERLPTLKIPITAKVSERVSISPTRIVITEAQKKIGVRIIRLSYLQEQPVEITELKSNHPQVTLTTVPQPARPAPERVFTQHTIRINIPAWDVLPDEGTSIEICTNDPDPKYQRFVVPIDKRLPHKPTSAKKGQRLQPILKPLPGQQPKTVEPARKTD